MSLSTKISPYANINLDLTSCSFLCVSLMPNLSHFIFNLFTDKWHAEAVPLEAKMCSIEQNPNIR
jgi:hypothetical protein